MQKLKQNWSRQQTKRREKEKKQKFDSAKNAFTEGLLRRAYLFTKSPTQFSERELETFRSVSFALIISIFCLSLIYFNYLLLGEFFSCVFLALLTSLSLKPSKIKIIQHLQRKLTHQEVCYTKNALICKIFRYLRSIISLNLQVIKNTPGNFIESVFADIYILSLSCLIYILYTRTTPIFTYSILGCLLLIDLILRFTVDAMFYILDITFSRRSFLNELNKPIPIIHTLVSVFLVFMFFSFILLLISTVFMFSIMEIYTVLDFITEYFAQSHISEYMSTYFQRSFIEDTIRYAAANYGEQAATALNVTVNMSAIVNGTTDQMIHELYFMVNNTLEALNLDNYYEDLVLWVSNTNTTNVGISSYFSMDYFYQIWETLGDAFVPYFKENYMMLVKLLKDILSQTSVVLLSIFNIIVKSLILYLFQVGISFANFLFIAVVYFTVLFYLLTTSENTLKKILEMIPLSRPTIEDIEKNISNSMEGLFYSSFTIFIYHSVFTWFLFDIFNVKLQYLLTLLAGLISILPIISIWMLAIPPAFYIYYWEDNLLMAVLLFAIYFYISMAVDSYIYAKRLNAHPYLLGMSVAFGLYSFGIEGVIYGPILLCITLTLVNIIRNPRKAATINPFVYHHQITKGHEGKKAENMLDATGDQITRLPPNRSLSLRDRSKYEKILEDDADLFEDDGIPSPQPK